LHELETRVKERYLILSRVRDKISDKVMDIINKEHLELIATIPDDEKLFEMDSTGESVWSLENSPAYNAVSELLKKLNLKNNNK
jgi:CO dehydrogenase nickel-insertion accessory protein CooC1